MAPDEKMNLTARDIAAATGGWVEMMGEAVATGLSTDTRTMRPGDLFLALAGPNFDGHAFAVQAAVGGAAGLVVQDRALLPPPATLAGSARESFFVIRVPDTLTALGDLAAEWRRRFEGKVVAVTGSNGKTTTKEMTAAILSRRWKVVKSQGNFNNLVGLPLTILGAETDHQAMVLEAGMNHPGEIGRLTDIADPDVGVITSIAPAHLEYLVDIGGVRKAKGELLERMKGTATAVLNADDDNVTTLAHAFAGRVVRFGLHPGADVRAEKMVSRTDGTTAFDLVALGGRIRVAQSFLGRYNVSNALAAAAAAMALGFTLEEIRDGLATCRPLGMRFEPVSLPGGVKAVNDTYNANPGSVRAAVETFMTLVVRGRRFVALGDMLELGAHAPEAHREMGRFMAEHGLDFLVTVGREAREAANAFNEKAGAGQRGRHAADHLEAAELLAREMRPGDAVLIKGSRGMGMETVLQALEDRLAGSGRETA